MGMENLDCTVVRPQTTLNPVVAPTLPDTKILSVLRSPEKDSDAPRRKKLEFSGFRPFSVNATAIVFIDPAAAVFLTTMNLDTNPKSILAVSPNATVEDVTNGVADTE